MRVGALIAVFLFLATLPVLGQIDESAATLFDSEGRPMKPSAAVPLSDATPAPPVVRHETPAPSVEKPVPAGGYTIVQESSIRTGEPVAPAAGAPAPRAAARAGAGTYVPMADRGYDDLCRTVEGQSGILVKHAERITRLERERGARPYAATTSRAVAAPRRSVRPATRGVAAPSESFLNRWWRAIKGEEIRATANTALATAKEAKSTADEALATAKEAKSDVEALKSGLPQQIAQAITDVLEDASGPVARAMRRANLALLAAFIAFVVAVIALLLALANRGGRAEARAEATADADDEDGGRPARERVVVRS